jgi:DNA polymerase-3 subunit beta
VFARESANIVSLSFSDGQIELSSESARSGNQKTTIDAKIDGGALKVMFNYRFIEEFLSSTTSDTIFIDMVDAYGPVLFSDPAQKFLTHIIMPVKL